MRERVGEAITGEDVLFSSYTSYVNCTFENCNYAFDGTAMNASNCSFGDGMWEFTGAAGTTLDVIGAFWAMPGSEFLLEGIFERITGDPDLAARMVALKSAS